MLNLLFLPSDRNWISQFGAALGIFVFFNIQAKCFWHLFLTWKKKKKNQSPNLSSLQHNERSIGFSGYVIFLVHLELNLGNLPMFNKINHWPVSLSATETKVNGIFSVTAHYKFKQKYFKMLFSTGFLLWIRSKLN